MKVTVDIVCDRLAKEKTEDAFEWALKNCPGQHVNVFSDARGILLQLIEQYEAGG
jgi:hypothetical protein